MSAHGEIPVVTIDGPSGSGKGTVSARVARQLGWNLLDSGALYRVVALAAEEAGIALQALDTPGHGLDAQLAALARQLDVRFRVSGEETVEVWLNGSDASARVRTETCGNNASRVAAVPSVRSALLERQRDFLAPPGLVADGRDMGTVVFPAAKAKIYLTASAEERAKRRYKQLKQKGLNVNLAQLSQEIEARDRRDASRTVAPLKPAEDACLLDTTAMPIDQVVAEVLAIIRDRYQFQA